MASDTDDKKYNTLMAQYKRMRTEDPDTAEKYLRGAMKLREQGNVSQDAITGAAYL